LKPNRDTPDTGTTATTWKQRLRAYAKEEWSNLFRLSNYSKLRLQLLVVQLVFMSLFGAAGTGHLVMAIGVGFLLLGIYLLLKL
jgi:predicted ribonuclease YlaK